VAARRAGLLDSWPARELRATNSSANTSLAPQVKQASQHDFAAILGAARHPAGAGRRFA
jgi:hypothetical protein